MFALTCSMSPWLISIIAAQRSRSIASYTKVKLKKPVIKFDVLHGMYTCVSVERTPGELCFITGNGSTPKAAFEERKITSNYYISAEEAAACS